MEREPARDADLQADLEAEKGRLLSFIRRTLRDRDEAEDVLQDVYEEYASVYAEGIESLGAWLTRVARNKIIDRFRRKKVRREHAEFVRASSAGQSSSFGLGPGSGDTQADEGFELRAALATALEQLPSDQRDVFIANELEGKSFEEIAAETGVNINTLLARKRYAVRFLRDVLKEFYDE